MAALFARAGATSSSDGEDLLFELKIPRILRWRTGYLSHKQIRREKR
jgi:hypothetical protein